VKSVEKGMKGLRSGYTDQFSNQYFSSLSKLVFKHDAFLKKMNNIHETLSKKDRAIFDEIVEIYGEGQGFQSLLIIPAQRGPRHELLFRELNKKTVGKYGYFGSVLENVKSKISSMNSEKAYRDYVISKNISPEYLLENEQKVRDIVAAKEERANFDEKINKLGSLVSGALFNKRDSKKVFIENMLTDLSVALHKAKKNNQWESYFSKIDQFKDAYNTEFRKEKEGKVSKFLDELKKDAISLKEKGIETLVQEDSAVVPDKVAHQKKFSSVMEDVSKIPHKQKFSSVMEDISQKKHDLHHRFDTIGSQYEGLSEQRAQVASQEIGAGVVQRAKDSLSTAAREKATVEPKEMVSAYKKVEEKSGVKGIIASIESKVKQEQEQLKKAKLPKSPV
jgi:hypothetical protein